MISCQPKLLSIHLLVALDLKAGRNILQKAECRLLQATEGEVFKTDDTGKDTRLSVVTRHHSHIKELALVPPCVAEILSQLGGKCKREA